MNDPQNQNEAACGGSALTAELDAAGWKAIAMALGQRVNFAITNLKAEGSGVLGNLDVDSREWQHWRDYMADGLEMLPGVTVDREMMHTLSLPRSKRKKEQDAILAKREASNAPAQAPAKAAHDAGN